MFKLISFYTENYQPLVNQTWHNNKKQYAERHNYGHELFVVWPEHTNKDLSQLKTELILSQLNQVPEGGWIWWSGADVMITNLNVKLENIVDNNFHIMVASDFNGINDDSLFVRNTQPARDYFQMMVARLPTYTYWERGQGIMKETYNDYKDSLIKLVPQKTINAYNLDLYRYRYPPPHTDQLGTDGNWSIGDFVIHWPAQSLEFRLQAFEYYSQFIIR